MPQLLFYNMYCLFRTVETPVPTVCASFEPYFGFLLFVIWDAGTSSPTVCASLEPSPNFAFCLLHFALAQPSLTCRGRLHPEGTSSNLLDFIRPRRISLQGAALPHVAQFATYHDGFAVYITASLCDAYISCDSVALYHAP